ncbi:MAG: hypothetical protein QME75_13855 [Deltaproteobacteria bacterium]|nr:hypothetical protein [Deltaproteobacteria bacterium]
MFLDCLKLKAAFPSAGYVLQTFETTPLQWDCHHGTTFILRVANLDVTAIPEETFEAGISIEVGLSPREKFISQAEKFAAAQQLDLPLSASPPSELTEQLTLSAVHLPQAKLFIFAEVSQLKARPAGKEVCEMKVTGNFKVRQIPCREADLVIHLEKPAAARLLSFLMAQAR